ncbi:hypothetical protein VNO78_32182 [Psophocarpus tetragonolobus]|uniref:Uncharacterized protein n=1 Tax=Psophocarpus tetragonolobus TaxID=3891 RepID=A0AAN9X9B2_PSOTE
MAVQESGPGKATWRKVGLHPKLRSHSSGLGLESCCLVDVAWCLLLLLWAGSGLDGVIRAGLVLNFGVGISRLLMTDYAAG